MQEPNKRYWIFIQTGQLSLSSVTFHKGKDKWSPGQQYLVLLSDLCFLLSFELSISWKSVVLRVDTAFWTGSKSYLTFFQLHARPEAHAPQGGKKSLASYRHGDHLKCTGKMPNKSCASILDNVKSVLYCIYVFNTWCWGTQCTGELILTAWKPSYETISELA